MASAEALRRAPAYMPLILRRASGVNDAEASASRVSNPIAPTETERDPDAVLVCEYLAGDAHAFETLFRRYQTPVFNMVSRMVGGEDARDLTQDVFCNALRALRSFRGESKFSTWLYSIARNVCLNHLRHVSCISEDSLEKMNEDKPQSELNDGSPGVEAQVELRELQSIVNSVLATLPPEQRMLIVLRDFEQLSYEEIVEVTDLSLANVKSKLHRARTAFKNRFRPHLHLVRE